MPTKIEGAIRKDILLVPLEQIEVNPESNYRQDLGDLEGLAQSIALEGMLQPLRVKRGQEGQLTLISGFRRFAAVQELAKKGVPVERVPCVFQDRAKCQEGDVLVAQLLENAHRKDATDMERARAYDRLVRVIGLGIGEVAARLGESESTVRNHLALLTAPTPVQKALEGGKISMTAAAHILKKAGDDEDKAREYLQAALDASSGRKATVKAAKKASATPSDRPRRRTRGFAEVEAKIEEVKERMKEDLLLEQKNECSIVLRVLKWVGGADIKVF